MSWIENYTCIQEAKDTDHAFTILNNDYVTLNNGVQELSVSRVVQLYFDEEDLLEKYVILFYCGDKPGKNNHDFYNDLVDEIGLDQLFHYTQLSKRDYRKYKGTYNFEHCKVDFKVPDHDFLIFQIIVNAN